MAKKTFIFPDGVSIVRFVADQGLLARRARQALQLDLGTLRNVARRAMDPGAFDLLNVVAADGAVEDVTYMLGGVR